MLNKSAQLFVSGLLREDEEAIKDAAFKAELIYAATMNCDKWISIKILP
jgi:hypothetical protein